MEILWGKGARVTKRLDRIGEAAVKAGAEVADLDSLVEDIRMVVLVVHVESDLASIAAANYGSSAEAAKDIELLAKALRLDV